MSKLKDVQFSIEGEQQQNSSLNTHQEQAQIAVMQSSEPQHKYLIYKLVNTKIRGRVYVDGIDDVINPKTGRMERIWLLTGAPSIWSTELVDVLKDKDFMRNNRRSILFESGICRVPDWDLNAIEFISVCRHFIGNLSRRTGSKTEFFLYDPQKQQQDALKRELLEMDMAIVASKMEEEPMRKLAHYLGVIFYDELGQPKSPDGIRRELMLMAKRDPVRFQKSLSSKEVEVSYLVKKAILDVKIDLGSPNGEIRWADGGVITKIPASRQPHEYLVELALTNTNEGRAFLKQLEKTMST